MQKFYGIVLCLAFLTNTTFSAITIDVCGVKSDSQEVVFETPNRLMPGNCTFELDISVDTCNVRIYFEKFLFKQPERNKIGGAYVCDSVDQLQLIGTGIPNINLPLLCGNLTGQHINVPTRDYNEQKSENEIEKKLTLSVNVNDNMLERPIWILIIMQLPCLESSNANNALGVSNLPPVGCLQYYSDSTGTIESLNYNNGNGHYFANLNYAICFERRANTRELKISVTAFQMASNSNSSHGTDRDCDSLSSNTEEGIAPSMDYVVIPDGVGTINDSTIFASKYCGNSLENLDVKISTPGPLYIGVSTDHFSGNELENGFQIGYVLISDFHDD